MIYTIGHSNFLIERMIELLQIHHIEIVYDIRSVPYSRFPRFNKDNLARTLLESGISYIFGGGNLGGRINDSVCFKDRIIPERKVNIAELVDYHELIRHDWFQRGIEQLIETSKKSRTAIMCSEENPARCHRHLLVARRLVELGVDACHIRGDGRLEMAIFEKGHGKVQQKLF